ncbi:Ditrans,polycis-undecaprenyl-diphosphate synthase ((2E,6E)-farnesyl-diphosphate specific) [Paraliobacillus ryukyuensis]|uniref:Isoprenyl transferase n=1 Tax=Paraliobacillus ryukyuensis TaxID=200904 RepID=A0A366EH90_9BACI|nr:isoprenyl transferase [Paraliobacillus ryukyuensis]RBP01767.1 undecaprenyl pyrophosphate synthetase [Paraliobacillus ryukyuensis]
MFKIPFFKKNKNKTDHIDHIENVPEHVAIIMDGNGRWAKKKGLPRFAGHKQGMDNVRNIVRRANNRGIKILTMYAFSTENWKRPRDEVDYIMKLPKEFIHNYLPELIQENVRIQTIGDFNLLPAHTKQAVNEAKERTKSNDGLILNIALNYGSRGEILQAVQQLVKEVESDKLSPDTIDEQVLAKYLYTTGLKDPDLVIRTSGEQRLSNFLLWQVAYAEFWFTDKYWPDFDDEAFDKALLDYQNRKRRFGGLTNKK